MSYNGYVSTSTVIDSLRSIDANDPAAAAGLQWLSAATPGNNDYLGHQVLTLTQAGYDTSTIAGSLFAKYDNPGWSLADGLQPEIKRTALTLLALKHAGITSRVEINNALNYLAAYRKRSSVWAWVEHVLGQQASTEKNNMNGIARARLKIGLTNLAYNMRRFARLSAHVRPPGRWAGC